MPKQMMMKKEEMEDKSPIGSMQDMERNDAEDNYKAPKEDMMEGNAAMSYIENCGDAKELHNIINAANAKLQTLNTNEEKVEGEVE